MSGNFQGFSPRTIDFMWKLRLNNERAWFEAHKADYQRDFQQPMKALAQDVFEQMSALYPQHGFAYKVARIYKDARRVRDGQPYRCNLWFTLERPSEMWTATPVFWFELAPDNWSYGLGYYQAKALTMAKLRARIDRDPLRFEALVAPLDDQNEFVLEGEAYARKKQAPTPKTDAWYNKKSFSLIHTGANDDALYDPGLAHRLVAGFKSLMPMYEYCASLDLDPDPSLAQKT